LSIAETHRPILSAGYAQVTKECVEEYMAQTNHSKISGETKETE